jgi:hypothetical protein
MNPRISNFTYVSTQTLQNTFPEDTEQLPLQMTCQPISAPKKTVSTEPKKAIHHTHKRIVDKA